MKPFPVAAVLSRAASEKCLAAAAHAARNVQTGVNMPAFRESCLEAQSESQSGSAAKPLGVCLVSLVVGGLLAGCVQDPLTQTSNRARSALLAAGDPDSLAAAGLVNPRSTNEERLVLAARASGAAPNRKDLAWLHLELCVRVDSCDVAPIEAQLHALDPGNAAVWSGS